MLSGVAVIVLGCGIFFAMIASKHLPPTMVDLMWATPALAAVVTALLSPRRKFLLGLVMAPIFVAALVLAESLYIWNGHPGDDLGPRATIVLSLAWAVPFALAGSGLGYFLTRAPAHSHPSPDFRPLIESERLRLVARLPEEIEAPIAGACAPVADRDLTLHRPRRGLAGDPAMSYPEDASPCRWVGAPSTRTGPGRSTR